MGASLIILASLPSFCQKLSKLVEIDEVLTKTNLHSFLRHGVGLNSNQNLGCPDENHPLTTER